jgi:hypothetical protein
VDPEFDDAEYVYPVAVEVQIVFTGGGVERELRLTNGQVPYRRVIRELCVKFRSRAGCVSQSRSQL